MSDPTSSLTLSSPDEAEAPPAPPPALYVVGRPGGQRDRWMAIPELSGAQLVCVDSWAAADFDAPGLVLFAIEDMSAVELMQGLGFVARGRGEWLPAVLVTTEEGPAVRPLSLGYAHPLTEALERNSHSEEGPLILELRDVIARVSVARHDINNPLTSGLAETQLLLMDITEGEAREGLETIQRQFRRVRDMVKELQPVRLKDA